MTEKGITEFLTRSLKDAADRIQNGDLTGGMTDASNAVSVAVAAMVVHTDNMIGAQLYIDMVREAIRDNVNILYQVHNKDPKAAWHELSVITKKNCDGKIGSF